MSILLLGAGGQLGRELRRALAPLGPVTALTRAEADFTVPDALARIVQDAAPDWVVNAAAYTAVDRAEAEPETAALVNAQAPGVLAEAAAAAGAWLVHYSTDYVFDGAKPGPYTEADSPAPVSVYGRTKLDGERAVRKITARHLIFRTSWVYAAHGRNFARTILNSARTTPSLRVVADQTGAPTSAALIADVTALAIARISAAGAAPNHAGLYHLAAGGEASWHGFAVYLVEGAAARGAELACAPDRIEAISSAEWPTAARRPRNSRLDCTLLCRRFGLTLPDWRHHADLWLDTVLEDAA